MFVCVCIFFVWNEWRFRKCFTLEFNWISDTDVIYASDCTYKQLYTKCLNYTEVCSDECFLLWLENHVYKLKLFFPSLSVILIVKPAGQSFYQLKLVGSMQRQKYTRNGFFRIIILQEEHYSSYTFDFLPMIKVYVYFFLMLNLDRNLHYSTILLPCELLLH